MKLTTAILIPALFLLPGCSGLGLAQSGASVATNPSTITPSQVKTFAEAVLASDAIVRLTKVAVDTNKLDAGTLTELQALRGGVRAALDALKAQSDAGHSLAFGSFNAAVDAYKAYAAVKGITQ